MLDAMSAEALKLTRHKASWFLVWLYPLGILLLFSIAIAGGLVSNDPPQQPRLEAWLRDTAIIWYAPSQTLGRYLIAAFVAVAFAGEYGWNTWKLIVPHRARAQLIAAKYAVVFLLFLAAYTLGAMISVLGSWAEDLATGDAIPAGITAGGLLEVHGRAALSALAPGLLTIAFASFAAILTRSTIAALVIAIVAITVEQLLFNFAPVLSVRAPGLTWALHHALPGYHLANIESWVHQGIALENPLPRAGMVALHWIASAGAAAAWVAGLAALTVRAFSRQDIN
jgi:ABC-type transport system involved in multi-copper enzyme maturation permease subunit